MTRRGPDHMINDSIESKSITPRKPSALAELAKREHPPLALIQSPPTDAPERDQIGNALWASVVMSFEATLSESETRFFHSLGLQRGEGSPEQMRMLARLDFHLVAKLEQFGVLLLMSVGALQRLFEARRRGDTKMVTRMLKAIELEALVFAGKKCAPLPDGVGAWADEATRQLDRLFARMRHELLAKTVYPTCASIAEWVKNEIESRPAQHDALRPYLAQLVGFIENLVKLDEKAAKALCARSLSSRRFFTLWWSISTNRSEKDLQNRRPHMRRKR
jgi:hypothetical protein